MVNSVTAESHMGLNPNVIFSCVFNREPLYLLLIAVRSCKKKNENGIFFQQRVK